MLPALMRRSPSHVTVPPCGDTDTAADREGDRFSFESQRWLPPVETPLDEVFCSVVALIATSASLSRDCLYCELT